MTDIVLHARLAQSGTVSSVLRWCRRAGMTLIVVGRDRSEPFSNVYNASQYASNPIDSILHISHYHFRQSLYT